MTTARPPAGSKIRHFTNRKPRGCLIQATEVREGIVVNDADQCQNPQMVTIRPLNGDKGAAVENVWLPDPGRDKTRTETHELIVLGWPVGMIALWSGYHPQILRDAYLNQPFRYDGERWFPVDHTSEIPPHCGEPQGEGLELVTHHMGKVVWDGVAQ